MTRLYCLECGSYCDESGKNWFACYCKAVRVNEPETWPETWVEREELPEQTEEDKTK